MSGSSARPWVPAVILVALFLLSAVISSQADTPDHRQLWEDVWALRRAGRYVEAAPVADALVGLRESDPDMPQHEIDSARGLAQVVHAAAALAPDEQRELALTDSLMGHLERLTDHEAGVAMAREHLEIRRRLLGPGHPAISWSLSVLAGHLFDSGRVEESMRCREEAVEIAFATWGDSHPFTADYMSGLALEYRLRGSFTAAVEHYRHVVGIRERGLDPDDPRIADGMGDLAWTLFLMGRYRDADAVCYEILDRWPGPLESARSAYTVLSYSAVDQGDYRAAERMARRSLEAAEAAFGRDHETSARAARDLASQFYRMGDLVAAEAVATDALARLRDLSGPRTSSTALAVQVLSGIHLARGDHALAEAEAREVLDIYREAFGDEHSSVASCLSWLAGVAHVAGDYARSVSYREEATAVARGFLGDDHVKVADFLGNLAEEYLAVGDFAAAESHLREALEIDCRAPGGRGLKEAKRRRILGDCLRGQGDLDGAEVFYNDCLAVEREMLGGQHQRLPLTLAGLGVIQHLRGDHASSEGFFAEAAAIHDVARRRIGTGMERAGFEVFSPYRWLAVSQVAQGKSNEAWTSAERASARALADLLADADRRGLTQREAAVEDSLRSLKAELERQIEIYSARADEDTAAASELESAREQLESAQTAWSAFRYEMAERYPESEGRVVRLDEVQSALGPEMALVGWLDVELIDGTRESRAYVVRDRGSVTWVELKGTAPDAPEPGAAARVIRDAIADPSSPTIGVARETRELWQQRFAPISDALGGIRNLVIVPSGPLLGVPVEALVMDDGRFVGEVYEISYSPSATVYARLGGAELARAGTGRSLLVGDPPFVEAHVAAMETEPDSPWELLAMAEAEGADASLFRGAVAGNDEALSGLPRLRGARAEVTLLGEMVTDADVLLGPDASEQELVSLAREGALKEYRTLHIATHALVNDEHPEQSALVLSQVGLPDPLDAAMKGERIYDGLLTAKEIVSECDLDADLVTLSACETGLGREMVGEGYVGFAHAFLQAGARSLVVSLWKVDDRATALLMQRFYENRSGFYTDERSGRVAQALPKAAALAEAKSWLRSYEDENGRRPYEHPYYWSAFVLIGDRE